MDISVVRRSALLLTTGAALSAAGVAIATPPQSRKPVRLNHTVVLPDPDAGDTNFRSAGAGEIDPRIAAMEKLFDTWGSLHAPNEGAAATDVGDIAVIEDDGSLILDDGNGGLVTNTVAILDAFYANHSDLYDEVVIFTASGFPTDVDPEAGFAFFSGRANYVAGINKTQGISDSTASAGITRLVGVLNMNDIPDYPADPQTDFLGGVASGVEILGQETEHAFAAFTQADIADILGRGDAHWSFFLNHPGGPGNASPMEGNLWQDNGDGTFITTESFNGYSPLDDYLYGIRAPQDVPPFYVIDSTDFNDGTFPSPGTTASGTRIDLTIDNIINLNGARLPDTTTSMKIFHIAFVLVVPQGTTPTTSDLDFMNQFRIGWENYFSTTTDSLGVMDTTLGLPVGAPLPFADSFDSGPNVDLTNWTYHQGTVVDSLGANEPTGDSSLHLDGQWGGADEIRSRTIDLAPIASGTAFVNYAVERGGNATTPALGQDMVIEYFNNANQWVTLFTIAGDGFADASFMNFSNALPDDALHNRFRLRFRRLRIDNIGVDDGSIFVDDVNISVNNSACVADINGDGIVNGADLATLLTQWGTNGPADFNNDGIVNGSDLALLLTNWGDCL